MWARGDLMDSAGMRVRSEGGSRVSHESRRCEAQLHTALHMSSTTGVCGLTRVVTAHTLLPAVCRWHLRERAAQGGCRASREAPRRVAEEKRV